MFRDLNLSSFLGGYEDSIMSKTSFMISGESFIRFNFKYFNK